MAKDPHLSEQQKLVVCRLVSSGMSLAKAKAHVLGTSKAKNTPKQAAMPPPPPPPVKKDDVEEVSERPWE